MHTAVSILLLLSLLLLCIVTKTIRYCWHHYYVYNDVNDNHAWLCTYLFKFSNYHVKFVLPTAHRSSDIGLSIKRLWVSIPSTASTAEIYFCRVLALRVYSANSVKRVPVYGGRGPSQSSDMKYGSMSFADWLWSVITPVLDTKTVHTWT